MHGHHSSHHRHHYVPRVNQPQGKVKHHYGSGKYTGYVVGWLLFCLVVTLAQGCSHA